MPSTPPEDTLDEKFMALFTRAKLRTTEVGLLLGVDRVTVSRYKSHGIGDCKESNLRRLEALTKIALSALKAGDLPKYVKCESGKDDRMKALKKVIRKHQSALKK